MAHIRFHIEYETRWGEVLCLEYKTQNNNTETLKFETCDGVAWRGEIDFPSSVDTITYSYFISDEFGHIVRRENGFERCFVVDHRSHVLICDRWELDDSASVLSRTAFTDCIYRRKGCAPAQMELLSQPYMLLMHAVPPAEGWRWGIVGSSTALGSWNPDNAKFMQRTGVYEWGISLSFNDFKEGLTYKFVLIEENSPKRIIWEKGPDRCIMPQVLDIHETAVQMDNTPLIDMKPWTGAGVVIPVFSLRSRESFGIGDFGDLRNFIGWAASTGLSAVQLLPINDTTSSFTWRDSYPYNGISVFALHPIYLDMREWKNTEIYASHKEHGDRLNSLPQLDYEAVMKEKMVFLHELFDLQGAKVTKSLSYKKFVHDNSDWLKSYAEFCVLRDENGTANFRDWMRTDVRGNAKLEQATDFYKYVQFLLHNQMESVHLFAREHGVILKGDIPIGICRDSVPAWSHPNLFHFDGQAGAPPDAFAVNGQNWGFPTYNWDEMSKDGYSWWRARLAHMGNYFDAYRIDHVLGFFRIWEVPSCQCYGVLGRFRPALPFNTDEIKSFGFGADVRYYSRAHISTAHLKELEQKLNTSLIGYFDAHGNDVWSLKPDYDTQRKIITLVPEGTCRDALMDVVSEVLFIEDSEQHGCYHPRITGQNTNVFTELSQSDKDGYNALYDNFFYIRHNEYWAEEALKKIPHVIDYMGSMHSMLPCAEDLGMVPLSVKGVLEKLHILSLEIQRMPKEYGIRFGNLKSNPYLSVSTIATHDMPPLRLWWKENKEQTQAFWNEVLGRSGEAPEEACAEVCEQVVSMHLESGSVLCLLSLQDWLAIDESLRNPSPEMEQINEPSNPNQYWQYRMHINIEDLMQATSFNEKIRALIRRSGRC